MDAILSLRSGTQYVPAAATILPMTDFANSKALLLGAGFVTRPTADELDKAGITVTVGMLNIVVLLRINL